MRLRRVVYVVATLIAAFVVAQPLLRELPEPTTNQSTRADGDEFQSPAGLVYGSGSRHGHRLKHVLAHGQDDPNRPGPHGVFTDGDQESIVALIDEAYLASHKHGSSRPNGNRQVLTVDMGRPIGYVGGQAGRRDGQPECRHVRLVLEGMRVITAYPVDVHRRHSDE